MFTFLLACVHFFSLFLTSHLQFALHQHLHFKIIPEPTIAVSVSPTETPTPSVSVSSAPTEEPKAKPTLEVSPTAAPTPTLEVSPTITPTVIPTMNPTETPTPTISVFPTPTEEPTAATPTSTVSITPTETQTPSVSISSTPTVTPTPTISITPTASPTPTLEVLPTLTATPTPTLTPTPTATDTPTPTPIITKVGNDISYPQCGQTLPTGQGFGIVGINGGKATTNNPCLSTELLWAQQSLGTQSQAKVQLYVNTGNPGLLSSVWPTNNIDPLGNTAPNPYGACNGTDSTACAWQYGWNRAVDDVQHKFIPAAVAAGVDAVPSDYPWWVDVETTNSWESGSSDALMRNRVDLEAMVSYFQSKQLKVGIYSTRFQWGVIVGSVPPGSNLNGLANWRPGASDLAGAQSNCFLSPLTQGGSISMTQFSTNFDYDYSCL